MFVLRVRRFLGTPFGTGVGVTQGYPASIMIFNIVVDVVVRAILEVVYGPRRRGMVWGGWWASATLFLTRTTGGSVVGTTSGYKTLWRYQ